MSKIAEETLASIKEARWTKGMNYKQIAEGAGVRYTWVRSFVYGKIKDPGSSRLEKIKEFLDSQDKGDD